MSIPDIPEPYRTYEKMLNKAENVRLRNPANENLVDVAKSILNMYSIKNEEAFTMPDANEVKENMRSIMPIAAELITKEFVVVPLFPSLLLEDIAKLYKFHDLPVDLLLALSLSEKEKSDKTLRTYIWLAWFVEPEYPTARHMVLLYRSTRGNPNPFARLNTFNIHGNNGFQESRNHPERDFRLISRNQDAGPSSAPNVQQAGATNIGIRQPSVVDTTQDIRVTPQTPPHVQHNGQDHHPDNNGNRTSMAQFNRVESEDLRKASYLQKSISDNKFTGDLKESIQTTLRMYDIYAKQYNVSSQLKSDLFVHAFDGAARTFFFNNTVDTMTFDEKAAVMKKGYDNDARQIQIKGTLDALRLKTFMDENDITDVSEGLTKMVALIDKLAPQTHPDFRTDRHKHSERPSACPSSQIYE